MIRSRYHWETLMRDREQALTYALLSGSEVMPQNTTSQASTLKPRAQRFPIQTPLRYRESGASDWIDSRTINISRSGLLFHAPVALAPKTMLEMQILFPSEITGGSPANVVCLGPVVRTEPSAVPDVHPSLAAAIMQYRFKRS